MDLGKPWARCGRRRRGGLGALQPVGAGSSCSSGSSDKGCHAVSLRGSSLLPAAPAGLAGPLRGPDFPRRRSVLPSHLPPPPPWPRSCWRTS